MRKPALQIVSASVLVIGAAVLATSAYAGKTLDAIKQRDQVVCGVNTGLAGFSAADSQGKWTGLDVDVCRAIAAAVLGDAKKVKWVPLNAQQRFTALQSGEVDILSRNTTFTLTRDASLGLNMTVVTYYDGQGFIVPKKVKIKSAKQLKNADRLRAVRHDDGEEPDRLLQVEQREDQARGVRGLRGQRGGVLLRAAAMAYTTDASGLASIRNKEAPNPDDHVILPELISKEPLGPMVRRGDDEWFAMVKWTIYGADRSRGVRHHAGERRPDEVEPGAGGEAHPRHVRGHRQAAGPGQGVAGPRNQVRRQLRRDLRAQRRAEVGAEACRAAPTTSGTRAD